MSKDNKATVVVRGAGAELRSSDWRVVAECCNAIIANMAEAAPATPSHPAATTEPRERPSR